MDQGRGRRADSDGGGTDLDHRRISPGDEGKIAKKPLHFGIIFGRKRLMGDVGRLVKINGRGVRLVRVRGHSGDGLPVSVIQKYVPRKELSGLSQFLRSRHLQIVFTTGVFDLLHAGHKRYLELAASLGDVLVVGINSDNSVRKIKGPGRPVLDQEQRLEMVCALGIVSYVTIFDEITGAETIKILRPDAYLCVEGSWNGDLAAKDEVVAMSMHGGKVYYAPRQSPTQSTTAILEKIGGMMKMDILKKLKKAMEEEENG